MIVVGRCDLKLDPGSSLYVDWRARVLILFCCQFDNLNFLILRQHVAGPQKTRGKHQRNANRLETETCTVILLIESKLLIVRVTEHWCEHNQRFVHGLTHKCGAVREPTRVEAG
jgi:hypothetical protein